jgi:hypothetical protein
MIVIEYKDDKAAAWYKTYDAITIPRMPLILVVPYVVFPDVIKGADLSPL